MSIKGHSLLEVLEGKKEREIVCLCSRRSVSFLSVGRRQSCSRNRNIDVGKELYFTTESVRMFFILIDCTQRTKTLSLFATGNHLELHRPRTKKNGNIKRAQNTIGD